MNWHNQPRALLLLLPLAALPACSSTANHSESLMQVDDLVARIERVHVESELAKERLRDALQALQVIITPDLGRDPVSSYAILAAALERSQAQEQKLRDSIEPMKTVAGPIFERWEADLETFVSPRIRERSQARLAATRQRYDAIVNAVEPALAGFEGFNQILHDHTLFLRHDLNADSVSAMRDDAVALGQAAGDIDRQFDVCLATSRAYVESSALPMRIEAGRAANPGR